MTLHFDVAIIGAGSAGAVLANRLSEDPARRVCLIEAGDWPSDPDIADPLKWGSLQGRDYDWAYRTSPQPFTAGRVHEWARGRIIGGSSCLHAMAYVRGHHSDFASWAEAGGEAWSWQGLLKGFERAESFASRATGGPLDVYEPDDEVSPVVRAYMAAGRALGVPSIQGHNTGELIGTTPNSLNIRNGKRLSVGDAYLTADVTARANLTILTGHEVERLALNGNRAGSILAMHDGAMVEITAGRIVLCAGAIASPLLLMRTGIGDPEVLKQAGIACVADVSGIGRNLQDHLLVLGNVFAAKQPVPPSRLQHSESLMYLDSCDLTATEGAPDTVLGCVVAPAVAPGLSAPPYGSAFTILCGVTHPRSRGSITPTGPGRHDAVVIDPNYLEDAYDRETFRRALEIARRVGHHAELDHWRAAEILPGPAARSDADLDAFVAKAASTHHHPCGTCRMGRDGGAVVDGGLKLAGFDNVFVVDASIFPSIPSGPINAAVIAMAENWALLPD